MLRIVGATLVVALVGSHGLNARCRLGAHKGRPYIDRFGADVQIRYLHDAAQKFSALQPGQQVVHRPLGHDLARLVRCTA